MRILAFDTETGGPSNEFSLLTAYFQIGDFIEGKFNKLDELDLKIKHDIYKVHPGGMAVNKISLDDLDTNGISASKAGSLLFEFLKKYSVKGLITPLGHGTLGDIEIITSQLLAKKTWGSFISGCYLDTGVTAKAYKAYGKIPNEVGLSLDSLCANYGLGPYPWHTAKGDTQATIDLFEKLV